MARSEQQNSARLFLRKAQEYLDSAEDNLVLERLTVAGGDAVHAGICAKDAFVTALSGTTGKAKDHSRAPENCATCLGVGPLPPTPNGACDNSFPQRARSSTGPASCLRQKQRRWCDGRAPLVATAKDIVAPRR